MIHRLALGALLLLACHHGAGGAGLAPCRLDPPSSGVTVPVDSLAGEYRLILKLRFYDEMPLKRIAGFLDLPLTTVKWRLHRAKQLLREQLEPEPEPDVQRAVSPLTVS